MLFRVLKILFPKSTMAELNPSIDTTVVLTTYNQCNIGHLSRCLIKLKNNDKCCKWRFCSAR